MAMLAERKRKQKWSLNPRGNEWAQDANKFGQKMLEKMGWQHGKGLGAKENGITEHVRISYKNDSKGMGYKESNDQWKEHDANFSALLESLTGEVNKPEEIKVQSLEKKSQTSRARVHYHKFTRGKDLSRYSEKDLANIFGKKTLKEDKKNETIKEEEDTKENESGFLFHGGSMRDYFKKKISGFGQSNGYVVGRNGVLKKEESESESESRPSFGFGFKTEVSATPDSDKKRPTFVAMDILGKRKVENDIKEETLFSPKKKSKKEGKQKKDLEENLGMSNPAFNPMSTPVKVQKHILEPIEESISEETLEMELDNIVITEAEVHIENGIKISPEVTPKKKRSSKGTFDDIIAEHNINSSVLDTPSKKKKKYKSEESGILNINFNSIQEHDECSQVEENPFEVKVKKKKNKSIECSMEESIKTENELKCKSKSKSKCNTSQELEQNEFDNPNFNDATDNSAGSVKFEDNPYEVKVKRKKKKKKKERNLDFDNPNFEDFENIVVDLPGITNNPYEIKVEKKKRKKDKSQYLNPSFNDSQELSVSSLQIEENPYEVKVKDKKKKNKAVSLEMEVQDHVELKKKKSKRNKANKEEMVIPETLLNLNGSKESCSEYSSVCIEESDLILNVVCTPVKTSTNNNNNDNGSISKVHSAKRRKSVRFSDVTKELIIPNNDDLQRICNGEEVANTTERFGKIKNGVDNVCFDKQKNRLDENIETISKTLDRYQAEIENDINEGKLNTVTMDDIMVGEVGNPYGDDERLPDGSTKLKFKHADFNAKTPFYHMDKTGARKSYKHLIKGDIVVKFNNTNLHEVVGYARKKKKVT